MPRLITIKKYIVVAKAELILQGVTAGKKSVSELKTVLREYADLKEREIAAL